MFNLGTFSKWENSGNAFATGKAFNADLLKSADSLCVLCGSCYTPKELRSIVESLNGFFSIFIHKEDKILVAVDRIRSYPLFFAHYNDAFYLSDDPYWIQKQLGEPELDKVSAAEFLLSGYVTGSRTLDPRIKQLQPGEILQAVEQIGGIELETLSYYKYCHHDFLNESWEEMSKIFDKVVLSAVNRLIKYANGRQIAVPLSGGFDSRLIAITLKRLGYDNFFAFSYGVPGNNESEVSKRVANNLKIKWHFVPYTRDMWKTLHESKEWSDYLRFAGRINSLAHVQDFPAVKKLLETGIISDDCVIVAGHSGDFLAGKQIPPVLLKPIPETKVKESVIKAIWARHYNLRSLKSAARLVGFEEDRLLDLLRKRVCEHFEHFDLTTPEGRLDAYDFEFWQEWLSKAICNSMRVYEFWGLDWWLPWYDAEYVGFWERVPLKFRLHKVFYDDYVRRVQSSMNVFDPPYVFRASPIKQMLKNMVEILPIKDQIYKLYWRIYLRHRDYWNHFLGWYGIVDYSTYKLLLHPYGHVNTIVTFEQFNDYLKTINLPKKGDC